ncbi:MAG: hypothetical protein OXE40_09075 [Gammaproteobacteria bacterium]|nr:hypothetical protein [Gammaproteobacteria bacterium]
MPTFKVTPAGGRTLRIEADRVEEPASLGEWHFFRDAGGPIITNREREIRSIDVEPTRDGRVAH